MIESSPLFINGFLLVSIYNQPKYALDNFFGQINPGDELEDVAFSFSAVLAQEDFSIRYENNLGDDVWISADRARLRQVCVILIDNARKHAHEGKFLDITLSGRPSS